MTRIDSSASLTRPRVDALLEQLDSHRVGRRQFVRLVAGPYYTQFSGADEQYGVAGTTEALAKAIGGEGIVVYVAGFPGDDVNAAWGKAGFLETLKKYRKINLAGELYGKYAPEPSQQAAATLLSRYPDTVGIAAVSDETIQVQRWIEAKVTIQ